MFTETQQQSIVDDCHQWHDELVSYREKIHGFKNELYYFAPGKTDREVAIGIEHFHNQFHVHLINIHDLKHEIRYHLSEANKHPTFGHRIPHHNIKDKLDRLLNELDLLESEFHTFIKQ